MFKKFAFIFLLLIVNLGLALAQTTDPAAAPPPPVSATDSGGSGSLPPPIQPAPALMPLQPTDVQRQMQPPPPASNEGMKSLPPQRPYVPMDSSAGQRFAPPPQPPQQPQFPQERNQRMEQPADRPEERMAPSEPDEDSGPRLDPGQIKRDLSDIKRAKSELKRLTSRAKKLSNLSGELQAMSDLSARLDNLAPAISGYAADPDSAQEALEELHDLDLWDKINEFRMKIELPDRLNKMEKDLSKTEKQLKNKSYQNLGVDISVLQNHLNEAKALLAEAKNKFAAGDLEGAAEEMNDLQERLNPGDIGCVANSLKEFKQGLAKVKDESIKQSFQEVIDPLMESAREGEYRPACSGFNEVRNELFKVMRYYGNSRQNQGLNDQSRQKLEQLQQKIEEKIKNNPPAGPGNQVSPPNRGAYFIDIVRSWLWF